MRKQSCVVGWGEIFRAFVPAHFTCTQTCFLKWGWACSSLLASHLPWFPELLLQLLCREIKLRNRPSYTNLVGRAGCLCTRSVGPVGSPNKGDGTTHLCSLVFCKTTKRFKEADRKWYEEEQKCVEWQIPRLCPCLQGKLILRAEDDSSL